MLMSIWLAERAKRLSPLAIVAVGWVGMVLYAIPGYMSDESIHVLAEARSGKYRDLAGVIWRIADDIIPGPFGMLLIQTACFIVGAYLLLRRMIPPRWAAACAGAVLWFPAISGTLGVIWTGSHGCAWLMLGAGCLGSARRAVRLAGIIALALGAAMVDAGPVIVLPLVLGLYPPGQRWRRLAICAGAWLAIAVLAVVLASRFSDPRISDRALLDIAGALYHGGKTTDAELGPAFAAPPSSGLEAAARAAYEPQRPLAEIQATIARTFGAAPLDAVVRTRDAIVSANRGAYLAYRWEVFRQLIQLENRPASSQVHLWFTNVQVASGSAGLIQHGAAPSQLQRALRRVMGWLGTTWLFVPYMYLMLAIALVPLCLQHPEARALIASGITAELAAFFVGADPQFRASLWLAVTVVLGAVLLFARRARRPTTARSYDEPTSRRSTRRPDTPSSSTVLCATAGS
jgi:hypothetical protein